MKKLMGISVIAALAVLPMAANAARTVTANANVTPGQNAASTLAAQSYVQGAYNAANNQINALIEDTAVAAKAEGNYAAIKAGDKVSENLVALDEKIATLESETNGTVGDLDNLDDSFGTADTVEEALGSLDGRLDTLEGDANTPNSVANKIATAVDGLDANVSNTVGADGLSLSVVEENGVITSVSGSIAANTYQDYDDSTVATAEAGTYTAITAGNGVGANLTALDSHVKANEAHIGTVGNLNTTTKTDLVTAINEVNTAVSNLNTDAGTTYQTKNDSTVAAGTNYLTAGTDVGANLTALDTQVATINNKQIPIVTDWTAGTVVNTKVSELVTAQ